MVRRVAKEGGVWHEPPYTTEEEIELYNATTGGVDCQGITILHQAPPPAEPQTQPQTTPLPPAEK